MKNPFKKTISKEKKAKKKAKTSLFLYLPVVVSFLPAFLLYKKTDSLLLTALLPVSVFALTFLFRREKAEKKEGLEDALLFYDRFYYYSALKKDYQGGFYEALESLPLSDFRDGLKDHIEKEEGGILPLAVTKTRDEFLLIGYVSSLLTNLEEYTPENREGLKKRIESFRNENRNPESGKSTMMMDCLLAAYLLIFLLSLLGHE